MAGLSPTEAKIFHALKSCQAAGVELSTAALLERFGLDRHTLKVHAYNMRRKGIPIFGRRGRSEKFGDAGGYFLGKSL